MIDENKTFEYFGYYSTNLTQFSNRKIVAICNSCGKIRFLRFRSYRDKCLSCVVRNRIITKETRQKLSIANSGKNNPMYGKHHSKEIKRKISNVTKGKIVSQETKQKLRDLNKAEKNPMFGKFKTCNPNWKGGQRIANRRSKAKRRTILDPNPIELNNNFKGSHGHHINPKYIINVPAELHRSISHRQTDGRGMSEINKVAFKYLYNNKENMILNEETIYFINLECYNK